MEKQSNSKAALSVVIITLNEELNIVRCLRSVQHLSDDVVVVDSGSTDRTEAICKDYHARFFHRDWEGYSATKNEANTLVKHPYILSLDADEALSPALFASIRMALDNGLNGVYAFNRLTNYCGHWVRHGGWYPDRKTRIFPKDNAKWVGDYVHEQLIYKHLRMTHLPGNLLHYSYYSVDEHRERIERYARLHAQSMKEHGKGYSVFNERMGSFWKFFQTYVLKSGFLDGGAGYTIAKLSASAVKRKYQYLKELT